MPQDANQALPPDNIQGHVVSVSAGGFETCALLDDNSVECWGWGFQALGSTLYPQPVNSKFSVVSVGGLGACGLLLANSKPVCWGGHYIAQPGAHNDVPMTDISVSGASACGIRTDDGNTICWSLLTPASTSLYPCWRYTV